MFICCVFVPLCTYISIFEKREKNVEARMIRPLHTWIWLFVLCSVAQSGFVHFYAHSVCARALVCVCICRAVFILDRVKWIDPVNPSMTLPIFILKSTVWRINKSDRKKTHILKRNRTQKKNCKYWRERKKTPKREEKTIGLVWTLWTLTLNSRHLEKYIKAAHSLMK